MNDIIDIRDHGGIFGGGGYGKNKPIPIENTPYLSTGGLVQKFIGDPIVPPQLPANINIAYIGDEFMWAYIGETILKIKKSNFQVISQRNINQSIIHASYDPNIDLWYAIAEYSRIIKFNFTSPVVLTGGGLNMPVITGFTLTDSHLLIGYNNGNPSSGSIASIGRGFVDGQVANNYEMQGSMGPQFYHNNESYFDFTSNFGSLGKQVRVCHYNGVERATIPMNTILAGHTWHLKGVTSLGHLVVASIRTVNSKYVSYVSLIDISNPTTPVLVKQSAVKSDWRLGAFYGDDGKFCYVFAPWNTNLVHWVAGLWVSKMNMDTGEIINILTLENTAAGRSLDLVRGKLDAKGGAIFTTSAEGATIGAKVLSQIEISK